MAIPKSVFVVPIAIFVVVAVVLVKFSTENESVSSDTLATDEGAETFESKKINDAFREAAIVAAANSGEVSTITYSKRQGEELRDTIRNLINEKSTSVVSGSIAAFAFSNLAKELPEAQIKIVTKGLISAGMAKESATTNARKIVRIAAKRGFRGVAGVTVIASSAIWAYQWFDETGKASDEWAALADQELE